VSESESVIANDAKKNAPSPRGTADQNDRAHRNELHPPTGSMMFYLHWHLGYMLIISTSGLRPKDVFRLLC